jgi:hypothetical protein
MTPQQVANRAVGAFQLLTGRVHQHQMKPFYMETTYNHPRNFMEYLRLNGIQHFLQNYEPLRPHQPKYLPPGTLLLPPEPFFTWPMGLLFAAIGDIAREEAGGPVYWRGWYRPGNGGLIWDGSEPGNYNRHVGGKSKSDHIWACAADFDILPGCKSYQRMTAAMKRVKRALKPITSASVHLLPTSIGWARSFFHLGLWAPETLRVGRCRHWSY